MVCNNLRCWYSVELVKKRAEEVSKEKLIEEMEVKIAEVRKDCLIEINKLYK